MDLAAARVRDWMIASPPVVTPQTSTATALRLLRDHHLPASRCAKGAGSRDWSMSGPGCG